MKQLRNWNGLLILFGLVAAATVFMVNVYAHITSPLNNCSTEEHIVSKNAQGDEVTMREELCEGIANSARATLILTMKGNKASEPFFIYDINVSSPTFEWTGDDLLVIKIKDEGAVYRKLDHVAGVTILYRQ